jgi:hypothetical protein
MKKILIISMLCCISAALFAQYGDFPLALPIANEGQYTISKVPDAGRNTKEILSSSCLRDVNFESHSAWLRCKVRTAGNIAFDLIPLQANDDLDFIVYRLPKGSFERKEELRCMAAGENIGDVGSSQSCKGITGLNNFADDRRENEGCSRQKDNFLAVIDANAGDEYAIVVNNFSSTSGFTIVFKGSAILEEVENNKLTISDPQPNPTTDLTRFNLNLPTALDLTFSVFNAAGQLVFQMEKQCSKGLHDINLPTTDFAAGVYQVLIKAKGVSVTRTLVKL